MRGELRVSIRAKEGPWYEGPAVWVRAFSLEGAFEIWPGHAPFLAGLVGGTLSVQTPEGLKERPVTRGLLRVENNELLALIVE